MSAEPDDDLDQLRAQLADAVANVSAARTAFHEWERDVMASAHDALSVGISEMEKAVAQVDEILLALTRERLRLEREGPASDLR